MIKRTLLAAALCFVAAVPAASQSGNSAPTPTPVSQDQPAAAPTAAASAAPEAESPTVCRTQRVTGSLTRRQRTCMTEAQWAELERRTAENMNDISRNASGGRACRQDQMGGC